MWRWRICGAGAVLILGLLTQGVASVASAATLRTELDEGLVAVLTEESAILVEALPLRGEGLLALSRRLCGSSAPAARIRDLNGGARELLAGARYRVPLDLLEPGLQSRVIDSLFPADEARADSWAHSVRGGQGESLWQIAEWFTGRGESFREIRDFNSLLDEQIVAGQVLLIPAGILRQPFLGAVATRALTPPEDLEYGRDRSGEYALYRLQSGEALYSAVVVRFTGRLFADDVNALATDIARRSDIADVTDIPVGYPVKIPLDLLSPQFLPPGHPGRTEYEANRTASARFSNRVRTLDLQGVTVVLDAGHGGRDVGASRGGVWESVYVYDIMQRLRRLLESRTAARVVVTTSAGAGGIEDRDVLSFSRQHAVLTDPPYTIEDARVGTNLRWYLSNSILERIVKAGFDPEEVVFVSIHADSLHPSLRGAMVYVPGLLPTRDGYGKSGTVYAARKEVQQRPRVSFSREERVRSEGLSRELAQHVIASLRRRSLAVHPNQPVRDKIVRGRGTPWVPAVLRYNAVPAKILVEVCNLGNPRDLELIQTRAFRQDVAQALADGLLLYYGANPSSPQRAVAAAGD
jgi:N-acetylmuramoyl-L-alanine amidase